MQREVGGEKNKYEIKTSSWGVLGSEREINLNINEDI